MYIMYISPSLPSPLKVSKRRTDGERGFDLSPAKSRCHCQQGNLAAGVKAQAEEEPHWKPSVLERVAGVAVFFWS